MMIEKKKLLLLCAMGLAGTACAQSTVTVFGVLDATVAHGRGSLTRLSQLTRGGLTTPRLGFRGQEDLGGGLKAGFWIEGQVNTDDGTGGATNSNNQTSGISSAQGMTWGRRSTVSLSGAYGELRLGRDIVPQYHNLVRGDAFGNVGVGSAINYTAIITGEVRVRASNMVSFLSPNVGGAAVQVSHYLGENPSGAAAEDDGTGSGIHLGYASGPLQLGFGWGVTSYAAGDFQQRNVHASWDFGVARVAGTYSSDRAGALGAKGAVLSVTVPLGPQDLRLAYSTYRRDSAGDPEGKKLALGYVYNFSKRTAAYFTAARIANSGGAAYALNGARTAADASSTGYDLGLRHTF